MKTQTSPSSVGGRLVSTDGRVLPLKAVAIEASAGGGLARTTIRHTFDNPFEEPLEVVYKTPLPADAAVTGYGFLVGERRIEGRVCTVEDAREAYDQALSEGRTSAMLEEDRSALFTQTVGNVPPGVEVVAELTVDHPLAWRLAEGGWQWRLPTTTGPRYLGAPGDVDDPERISVDVADGPTGVGVTLILRIEDRPIEGGRPDSPDHRLRVTSDGDHWRVELADDDVPPDRDLVVRWPVAAVDPSVAIRTARPPADADHGDSAYALLTLTPPAAAGDRCSPRDVIALIDTSGSMRGEPLAQATRVLSGLVGSLGPQDRLELIEFSTAARRWRPGAVEVTAEAQAAALGWLAELRAGGATEMADAVEEALTPLDPGRPRQVVLVSDGYVGFERRVVGHVRAKLPQGCTLHCVGVGSAVNRTLTRWASRAGRGREILVTLGEDGERAAAALVAATAAPVVTDVSVSGSAVRSVAPRVATDLLAGAPALVALELDPGGGDVIVRGRGAQGPFERRQVVDPVTHGHGPPAVTAMVGRERVADLELEGVAGPPMHDADERIEAIGLAFGLATRRTSWLAVDPEAAVDPRAPLRGVVMPHELPRGLSAEGLGLRAPVDRSARVVACMMGPEPPAPPPFGYYRRGLSARLRDWHPDHAPPRFSSGRFLWTDQGLVLEVTLNKDTTWRPPSRASVFAHGEREPWYADVDASRSTRPGEIPAGARLRVGLDTGLSRDHGIRRVLVGRLIVDIAS